MIELIQTIMPHVSDEQAQQLARYHALLAEWNGRMNLTAITEPEAAVQKHFADSALPMGLIQEGASLIDVGTGAGFPGLVLRILRPDIQLTLLDSLQKRIGFLQAVCAELGFPDVRCVHARAEDGARLPALREQFDIATARAVASSVLLTEWLTPYLKVGGRALLYKGPQAKEEFASAEFRRAANLLHVEAALAEYPADWGARSVIVLDKTAPTGKKYPRKAGTKSPL